MSIASDQGVFRAILLQLLAEVPEGAPPITGRAVTGAPQLLVAGQLRGASGGGTFAVVDPSTGKEVGVAADGTIADMDEAIGAARAAFDAGSWTRDAAFRARCLRQL